MISPRLSQTPGFARATPLRASPWKNPARALGPGSRGPAPSARATRPAPRAPGHTPRAHFHEARAMDPLYKGPPFPSPLWPLPWRPPYVVVHSDITSIIGDSWPKLLILKRNVPPGGCHTHRPPPPGVESPSSDYPRGVDYPRATLGVLRGACLVARGARTRGAEATPFPGGRTGDAGRGPRHRGV